MNIIQIENCTKTFAGLVALDKVSFQVRRGDIHGLIGPNGAGKTTLFNLLAGVYKPNKGKIQLNGKDIVGLKPENICRRGISRTFQVPMPFAELTVLQNVMVGTTMKLSIKDGRKKAMDILEYVGLIEKSDQIAGNMAVPDLRRLELARAMSTSPDLILLDEVMAGLRPTEVKECLSLIKGINKKGITIIVIEHIMEAVMTICKRISVLNYGRLIAEGNPEEVSNNEEVIGAYLGDEYVFTAS
jgi:branched-chain amino acid transport system ATP-binding protein